ncbi:MAG: hypothetical protein R6X35_04015 [Candidatus Krumholzibacteriia bacterium]
MNIRFRPVLLLLAAALLLPACSDESPTGIAPIGDAEVVSGDLRPAGPDFSLELKTAGLPGRPLAGPFVLHGENLRWVPEQGALAVDLSVRNNGREVVPEPVGLTFTALIPDSARVLDADNGLEGPGAAIVFGFANDDAMWTPGEVSFPRTVHFAVPEGAAMAFAARLDLGVGPMTGRIAGIVWHDTNHDGIRDAGEAGLPGVNVLLLASAPCEDDRAKQEDHDLDDGDDDCEDGDCDDCDGGDCGDWDDGDCADGTGEVLRSAVTDADGRYAFTGLPAGFYTLRAMPMPPAEPTTAAELHVLLATLPDGTVSSFTQADFGFALGEASTVMEFAPSADTTVRADLPERTNDNYGCDPFVAVGRGREGEPDRIRGLVRFDLPQFFREVTVVRATLEAPVARFRDGAGQTYHLGVHAVVPSDSLTPWVEGNGSEHVDFGVGCDWVDPAYGVAWFGQGDGGDANNQSQPRFLAEPVAVTTVVQDAMPPLLPVQWDVTALVRGWYAGRLPNFGVVVRDLGGAGAFRSLWFASREGEEAGMGQALRLVVEFADVPPPVR